jgi:3',5'-cyclic AMP phosphodiesterase CpdA
MILESVSPRTDVFIVWAHSDIQPNNPSEKEQYETAIRDVSALPFVPDAALIAGDLVHRSESQMYWDWMKKLRAETKIPFWYEIAGNHDLNDFESYRRNSGKPRHYAVRYGNILFIFLSDEIRSAPTDISDAAFEWWRGLVEANSDSIIVTVTHAALEQSGLISTINKTMCIKGSDRFWNVLREYPVDLWISGHSHLPNYLAIKSSAPETCRTAFIDISAIHGSFGSPIESWMFVFRDGSRSFAGIPRNHEDGKFYSSMIVRRELSRPFRKGVSAPAIVSSCE